MATMVMITNHAFERAKERLSIGKAALERLAERAYTHGVTHRDTRGRLNRYLDKLHMAHRTCNNVRLYGENVFIFSDRTLITVYQLPNHLKRYVKVFKARI